MRRTRPLFVAALLLAGCAALIPDQQVENLFGFDDYVVDLTVSPLAPEAAIAPQAAAYVAAGSVSREVDTSDLTDLPFDPTSMSESVRAQWIRLFRPDPPEVGAQAITDELPATLALEGADFEILFGDGETEFRKTVSVSFTPPAQFERNDASCTETRCNYLPLDENAASLDIEVSGAEIATVLAVFASAREPKIASGDARLLLGDDPLLAGVERAELRIDAYGGVIGFR